jgi:hypothetical protein
LVPSGKVAGAAFDYTDCSGVEGSPCRQKWRTLLSLTKDTCTLDGNYQLTFSKVCVPGFNQCPLREEDRVTVFDYALTSENFCAIVNVDVSLTATIKLCEDKECTIPRTTFMVGQRGYFLIYVDSDMNLNKQVIEFSKIKILTVTIRGEAIRIPTCICQKGLPIRYSEGEFNPNVEIELYSTLSPHEASFSFLFTKQLTRSILKPNSKKSFTVGVEVEAYYLHNAKKRFEFEVLEEEKDVGTFSVEPNVEGDLFDPNDMPVNNTGKTQKERSGVSVVCASILLLIVSLLF